MRSQRSHRSRVRHSFLAVVLLSCLLLLTKSVHAVSRSEAGKIDWHVPRIGVPHTSNHSATPYLRPRFHRIIKPDADIKDKAQTAIFVATESNVVGALNPRNGAIVWRQIFDPTDDPVLLHKQYGDVALTVSGNGGANVRLFHAFTGFNIWESRFHSPLRQGLLPEKGVPGTDAVFLPTTTLNESPADVIHLANARTVRRLDGTFGRQVWKWEPEQADPSKRQIIRLVAKDDKIHVVSLMRNTGSGWNSISVATLSANNGQLLTTHEITSGVKSNADVVLLPWNRLPNMPATANPGAWIAWLNKDGSVRAAPLDPPSKKLAQPQVVYSKRPESPFTALVDVGLADKGLFVARRSDGLAEVLKLSSDAKFTSFWEFEEDAYDAVYAGTYDRSGNAYIQRVFFQRAQHLLNFHFLWADKVAGDGKGQVSGFSFQWDHDLHGNVLASTFEASQVGQYQLASRTVLVTSSGSVRMLLEDQHQWILEEGLTQTTHAVMVDLPEKKLSTLEGGAASLDHEGFVHRLVRHAIALQDLPTYLVGFATRFATGSYGSLESFGFPLSSNSAGAKSKAGAPSAETTVMVKQGKSPANRKAAEKQDKPTSLAPRIASANTTSHLFRDPFGFRKVVVAATAKGKLYGLDTLANNATIWEKSLVGYGEGEGEFEPIVNIKLIHLVRELSTDGKTPLLAIVAEVELLPGLINTRVFQLNPLTGEFLNDAMSGHTVFMGRCREAFLLPTSVEDPAEKQLSVGFVDERNQVYLYPDTLAVAELFEPISDKFFFALQESPSTGSGAGSLKFVGHKIAKKDVSTLHKTVPVWTLPLPKGEELVQVVEAPSLDTIASYGRVLGDRTTLYKYLNPHTKLIITKSTSPLTDEAHIYLLDVVTGGILCEGLLQQVDLSQPIKANFVENWIVVGYSVRNGEEGLAQRLMSIELFEPVKETNSTRSSSSSSQNRKISDSWSGLKGNFSSFVGDSNGVQQHGDANDLSGVLPLSFAQTYIFPSGTILGMASTKTKFGISTKNLLVSTDRESIISIPRRLLDPRRPTSKPTKFEQEEMMIPYSALIPVDSKWTLSHVYPTAGIDLLVTAAALLESTSVVFAIGLDMFYSRVAPSGQFDLLQESFNKPQLIFTIGLLSAGIFLTKPMVKSRALSARW